MRHTANVCLKQYGNFAAFCSCNWEGPVRSWLFRAQRDRKRHERRH